MRKFLIIIITIILCVGSLLLFLAMKFKDEAMQEVINAVTSGYIDKQNHFAIVPTDISDDRKTYKYILGPFSDGMALITSLPSNRCRFIDTRGKIRSKNYSHAGDFKDGVAPVQRIADKMVGYIDKKDIFVITPRFTEARSFSQGLAAVRDAKARWGFIDRSGKQVIACKYAHVGDFHDGVAFYSEDGRTFGYLAKDGKVVCPPQFATIWDFSEGIGVADKKVGDDEFDRFFINPNGGMRAVLHNIAARHNPAHNPFLGIPSRCDDQSRITSQNWAGENLYGVDASFHSGYAAVCTPSGCYFADSHGNRPTATLFDHARAFHDGMAVCFKSGRIMIVDTTFHETLLPSSFDWVDDFSEDIALVYKNGYGSGINAIDKTGKLLWAKSSQNTSIAPFSEGLAATEGFPF